MKEQKKGGKQVRDHTNEIPSGKKICGEQSASWIQILPPHLPVWGFCVNHYLCAKLVNETETNICKIYKVLNEVPDM